MFQAVKIRLKLTKTEMFFFQENGWLNNALAKYSQDSARMELMVMDESIRWLIIAIQSKVSSRFREASIRATGFRP